MSDAIPAATLILLRDRDRAGPAEILMVERARAMAFAGGAWVFPGGRIDPDDTALATAIAPGLDDAPARIAAIRETLEETGIGIGLKADVSRLPAMRARLGAGVPFGRILAEADASLDLSVLTPYARWRPSHDLVRVFDTRFYIAPAPVDANATVDATENARLDWTTAIDMLARADAGVAKVIYPTRRNLERLAACTGFADARRDALRHPVRTIVPFHEIRGGTEHLCIPEGLGYPVTSEPIFRAARG